MNEGDGVRHLLFCFSLEGELCVMPCMKLETPRLILRPPELSDMDAMVPLIGDYDIAKNLSLVPHPYEKAHWTDYVASIADRRARGIGFSFVILRKAGNRPMGICGVHLKEPGQPFELGYWLGKPYWGEGFATEAARRVAAFAFHDLKADALAAGWFEDNPASGRVLEKLGFVETGAEMKSSLARGTAVNCRMMRLERENFGRRKKAA